jgi:hypothetical protein
LLLAAVAADVQKTQPAVMAVVVAALVATVQPQQ